MSKVSITGCREYETRQVFDAVKRAVDLVGGMEKFVKPGTKVLLKPNLLSPRPPEDCVDTHPEVVRALVRLVKGAGGRPVIGDSPGGFGSNIEEVLEISGMKRIALEEGAEIVKFTSSKFVDGIPVSRHVFDSGSFISIPKMKTHVLTTLTAAIKNTFGTLVGLYKAGCHSRAPKPEEFAKLIARVYSIARPKLTVVDAVIAMEGDGPARGELKNMGFIMAGEDAVAIDSCLARTMGLEPWDVLTTREAYAAGLGEMDPARIEIAGEDIKNFIKEDFKLPQTTPLKFLPKALLNSFASLVKFNPYIDARVCARCNLCKISCPAEAIEIEPDRCRIDYKKCVRCMCCHEVCPYRAIDIRRNVLTKAIWG
ncbi:MAG: DUF362 domain-containing protein [Candidatus Omnitrophota bacterium]